MRSFAFLLPTEIEFGCGVSRQVGVKARGLGASKALVVTDRGVLAAGLVDPVLEDLAAAELRAVLFEEVAPNPRDSSIAAGAALASSEGCDVVVAVGGGSPIDAAKGMALVNAHGAAVLDYEVTGVPGPITPLIAVPTTAGSGSEVAFMAVVTDSDQARKVTLTDRHLAPRVALVDPRLTLDLPRALTAATGLDALTRAIEAYTVKRSGPLTDSLALTAVTLLGRSLGIAYADGGNVEARTEVMLASLLTGIAVANTGTGGTHCMGEAAAGLYDLPRGMASAIFLPEMMEWDYVAVPDKFAEIARALGQDTSRLSRREAAYAAVRAVRELASDLRIPTAAEVGIVPDDLPRLAEAAAANEACALGNARALSEADFLTLFRQAF